MATTDPTTFGARLKHARRAAGLTQEQLAERAGLSPQAVGALESGRRGAPRRETVNALARALGLGPEQAAALTEALRRDRTARPRLTPPLGLPPPTAPLLGRAQELLDVTALLGGPEARLVVLTGPGGVGKTRLALQAAIEVAPAPAFADGVVWVDLSAVHDSEVVAATVAARLGVREVVGTSPTEQLIASLADRHLLLVLDNLEQLLPARELVQRLLDACPGLRALGTSRVPLGMSVERVYAVAPLPVPPPEERDPLVIGEHAAVTLFLERARQVAPRLAVTTAAAVAVASICRRVDGLPLAIELAAALVKLLPPQAMAARLDAAASAQGGALDLLGAGSWDRPDRQQTMRAVIAWSDTLLDPAERALFRRLSVFSGGCTPEAAAAVCATPGVDPDVTVGLAALLDKSLLAKPALGTAEPRAVMLETIREYAAEQLALSGEAPRLRERHAAYFLALAQRAEPHLEGPQQALWLERVEAELDNIRAALRRSCEGEDVARGLRLAALLLNFWMIRGHVAEGRSWIERLLGRTGRGSCDVAPEDRARALHVAGRLAYTQGDNGQALVLFEEGLDLARKNGDTDGMLVGLNDVGAVVSRLGEYARARQLYEEALVLRRERGETRVVAQLLNNLATLAFSEGDFARGVALSEESLVVLRAQHDWYSVATVLSNLGQARLEMGDLVAAAAACEEGLPLARTLQSSETIARFLAIGGSIARQRGTHDQARRQLVEALALYGAVGVRDEIWRTLEELASVAAAVGRLEGSALLLAAAAAIDDPPGTLRSPTERAAYEHCVAAATEALGTARFEAAWARGLTMPLDEAIALAFGGAVP